MGATDVSPQVLGRDPREHSLLSCTDERFGRDRISSGWQESDHICDLGCPSWFW